MRMHIASFRADMMMITSRAAGST
jgi:hypothetical protein